MSTASVKIGCRVLPHGRLIALGLTLLAVAFGLASTPYAVAGAPADDRLRIIIETDAGGDPDDEQSLVRFLLYVNEWDVEGIIANRQFAREGENLNPVRTGLGIVRACVSAYRQCYPSLLRHDSRYPDPAALLQRTVPGHQDTTEVEELVLLALEG